jgi:hypothetical protein
MEPVKPAIKNYADGWITEREGTEVPGFLKLAFAVIALGCMGYLILFMNGEVDHADRGPLVRAFNAATETSATLMYGVAALMVVFGIIVVLFSVRKSHD